MLPATVMPKNIVLFSDGTGNSAAKLSKTNVWRLYQALDLSQPSAQVAYYDDGVGTSSFKPLAVLGGAFGWGLARNIIDLYTFLCCHWEPEDRIYCFGFSRGAFTVRMLTGLIATQGIVRAESLVELRRRAVVALRQYRSGRYSSAFRLEVPGRILRDLFLGDAPPPSGDPPGIEFLGVWDTVAAYGLPVDELTRALSWFWPILLPDRQPLTRVRRIRHAMALDDERNTFHPVLFNEEREPDANTLTTDIRDERVTQVWFAGMHSSVGGGYPDDGLAHISLDWMAGEAAAAGLLFHAGELDKIRSRADTAGRLYDSRRGAGGFYRYLPRKMAMLTNQTWDARSRVVIPRPKIHWSVLNRIGQGADRYAPLGLPSRYAVVERSGRVAGSHGVLEHATQAEDRANAQEAVWNLVWWKRVVYFSSILTAGGLAAFPLYRPAAEACEGPLCVTAPLIQGLGSFLPDFAQPWIDAYRSHPAAFALLAAVFAVLVILGSRVQGRIFARMRSLWTQILANPRQPVVPASLPADPIYRFRTHAVYQWFFRQLKTWVLPAAFGMALAAFAAAGAGRVIFAMLSSGGFVCSDSGDTLFSSNSPCWPSGQRVEAGRRYRITIAPDGDWRDDDIAAGLSGFGAREMGLWRHAMGLPWRRRLGEPWFRPIARIGAHGTDEYPLHFGPDNSTEFRARRSGELFLFVNDAILPLPNRWQWFYRNNRGTAQVTVVRAE